MTYLHIHDQGLPKHALGERRTDHVTAENVHDALRAHGLPAAAQAMEYQQVDMDVALRVLVEPGRRRGQADAVATPRSLRAAKPEATDFPEFVAVPA
jgi:hypothetical protein